jgi:hypothetical protein
MPPLGRPTTIIPMVDPRRSTSSLGARLKVSAERAKVIGLTLAAAVVCCDFSSRWLPVFGSCRMFYRTHNPIEDTLLCRVFAILRIAEIILVFLATAIVWWAIILSQRARRNVNEK